MDTPQNDQVPEAVPEVQPAQPTPSMAEKAEDTLANVQSVENKIVSDKYTAENIVSSAKNLLGL